MTIDWLSFLVVFAASIVSACVVVVLFATGIRLFATPHRGAAAGSARDEEMDDVEGPTRPAAATAGGVVLFVLSAIAVLYGIYLIVPFFHG
jgi:hypothetical protein